ncbi:MAG: EamA family transporter [Cypionkella sp.]|nr:EamA family transporter [Cypionkella sp.]
MSDWLISLEGTVAGQHLAMALALLAAVLHALFGALQKGRFDPWVTRGAVDASYALMAAPFALFIVPWPERFMWPIFAGMVVIHVAYKVLQAKAYTLGAYTVVYPVVRGTGPLFTVLVAGAVFAETYTRAQWLGVLLLSGGILGLAGYNYRFLTVGRATLLPALGFALATGVMVAVYTTYDAWGIRATADPFTFLAWFFFLDGLVMPIATRARMMALPRKDLPALARLGFIGAIVALFSFGAVMLATRLDKVGEAAVLRETSTVFAALIAWAVLGEKVGWARASLMALIALGAVVMEFGG